MSVQSSSSSMRQPTLAAEGAMLNGTLDNYQVLRTMIGQNAQCTGMPENRRTVRTPHVLRYPAVFRRHG